MEETTPRFRTFTRAEMIEVAWRIGDQMLKLPAISRHCRHRWPLSTLTDYVRVGSIPEKCTRTAAEYLRDMLTNRPDERLNTPQLLKKWFGSYEKFEIIPSKDFWAPSNSTEPFWLPEK